MNHPSDQQIAELLERAGQGDRRALDELLAFHRDRLLRMVHARMDPRLRTRVDDSDVIQETLVEACERLPEYFANPRLPFFTWLRFLTAQKLNELHRHHVAAQKRTTGRELQLKRADRADASSWSIADAFLADETSPSQAAQRAEARVRLKTVLDGLEPHDREVLMLRLVEQLTNEEAAAELGMQTSGTSKRFVRALQRLRDVLRDRPEG